MNSSPSHSLPVLITGAGPTGLTLACDLARRGVAFRIVDKAAQYFAGSRGKGLQPRSLEIFDDLGLIDRILAHGRFHLPFRAYEGATVLGDHDPHESHQSTPHIPYGSTLIIPQWRVEEILRSCLEAAGARVELGTELIGFEQNDDWVTATLQNQNGIEQVRAVYLVAADGGRSFVRKTLNVGFEGETWKDERMLVGDVRVDHLDRDHWHAWPKHPEGWLTLCPLPSTEMFQLQAKPSPGDTELSLEAFQRIVDERTGRADLKLYDPTWLSLYIANVRMIDRYRIDRIFLAGDAAHVHSPAGGQGMNTGIQDAYNLGWKLAAVLRGVDPALLDTYQEERLPIAAEMLGVTTKLHRQIYGSEVKQIERGAETLQLDLNYRGCSLSGEDNPPSSPLRAGDRAPDAPLLDQDGHSIRLFDLFRGPHFTLLVFGNSDAIPIQTLTQRYGGELRVIPVDNTQTQVIDAYGYEDGALFLIRPDGYVGFIGGAASAGGMDSYLQKAIRLTPGRP